VKRGEGPVGDDPEAAAAQVKPGQLTEAEKGRVLQRGYAQSFFGRRNPTKTLGFLLPWISFWISVGFMLSSPPYAHCTVLFKTTKLSCFGGFFPLFFLIQAIAWFSWSCFHAETRTKLFFI
jgi:hypothetical protein